jgi:uncharacterized protein (TIGR02266 family)
MSEREHRRAPRVAVDLPARYRSGSASLDGRAGNLSQNGMFFHAACRDELAAQQVQIEIDLPDHEKPITLTGEVRWIADSPLAPGMGIRFTQVSMAERRRLANYVILRAFHHRRAPSQF